MAKQAPAKAQSAGESKGFKPAWLLLLLLLPAAALTAPVAIVLVAALVPTIVARIVDSSPARYLTFTVLSFNLVGSLYLVQQIFAKGNDLEAAMLVLKDPFGWLAALSGAGCGWLLFFAMPTLTAKMAEAQSALRMRRVHRDQTQLISEWGEAVSKKD